MDDVVLEINGRKFTGWTATAIVIGGLFALMVIPTMMAFLVAAASHCQ